LLEPESEVLGPKGLSFEQIIRAVERCLGVSEEQIVAYGRIKKVALARQVAMYLAREDLGWHLSKIGARLGGRDHTTVGSNCNRIRALMNDDPFTRELVEQIRADYPGEIAKTVLPRPVNGAADGKLYELASGLATALGATLVTKNGS
jgi:hypothetical protein